MELQSQYWFPAKRYGWGWGLPLTWQGWVTLAQFITLIALGAFVIKPHQRPGLFALYVVALIVAFVAICLAKGEPPSWRWGH